MRIKELLTLPYNPDITIFPFADSYNHLFSDIEIYEAEELNKLITNNSIYSDEDGSGRGVWLDIAYFNEKPFALMYSAGRSGKDNYNSFIFDKETYSESIDYIRGLVPADIDCVSIDDDISELDVIYNRDMSKELFNLDFTPSFSIGDHISVKIDNDEFGIHDNCTAIIINVDPQSSSHTYRVRLFEYKRMISFTKGEHGVNIVPSFDVPIVNPCYDTLDEAAQKHSRNYFRNVKLVELPISSSLEASISLIA